MKIGKVRPTFKGEWDSTLAYEVLDWVQYRGLAYQAIQDVPVNREPDVTPEYWAQTGMLGEKGDKGDVGPVGPAGVNGRDGLNGAQGPQGVGPQHRWEGSALAFTNSDGTWAAPVDLRGAQGVVGPEGAVGPQGIPGPLGPQGPQGPQGIVGPQGTLPPLNNTVTSISTSEAATANAVKVAYDRGTAGVDAAAAAQNTANEAKNITNLVRTAPAAWCVPQAGADGKLHAGWIGGGGTVPAGHIALLPQRYYQLPPGWYFCNGTRYNNGTAQANALNALSAEFKADWGITNNGATINVPNWFYGGRGPAMRAVDGSSRQVGSVEDGAIQNIVGGMSPRVGGGYGIHTAQGGVLSDGALYGSGRLENLVSGQNYSGPSSYPSTIEFSASRVVPTANEVRMLNRGMTPAIFLGV